MHIREFEKIAYSNPRVARDFGIQNKSNFGDSPMMGRVSTRIPRILVAEDDVELRTLMSNVLRGAGYNVVEVTDGIHLRERLVYSQLILDERFDVDLIISDIRMPGLSGFEALNDIRDKSTFPPVILITAFGDQQTFLRASRFGAVAFFDKPIDFDKFCEFVAKLLRPTAGQESA